MSEAKATENYQNYGVLYNWTAALDACPAGWHLPSHDEWTELERFVCSHAGSDCAEAFPYDNIMTGWLGTNEGNALKSCRQLDSPLGEDCATSEHPRWDSRDNHYDTDDFGFSALPGGLRIGRSNLRPGYFLNVGYFGVWWTSTENSSTTAWRRTIGYANGKVSRDINTDNDYGFSVRRVRD